MSGAYKSDTRGNTTEVIDPSNNSATYGVNKLDQVESESKGESFVKMTYDATGELSAKQILTGVDANGQPIFREMTFGVDEVGRLHTRSDGDQATTIGYDPKGNIKTFTRSGKPPATFGYDTRDRFTTETVGTQNTIYGYDDNNALATLTNARNKSTIYVKSGFGESLGDTNPIGITTRQTTDAAGRPIDSKIVKNTSDGKTLVLRWSKQEFDPLGRVTRQIQKLFTNPLELPSDGSDPAGATDVISRTIYDDTARKTTAIDPRGNATVSEMDELGRLLRVTDALGDTLEYEYDANGNKHSETMTEVAPDGRKEASKVTYMYDTQNRVVERIDVTNPASPLETRYGYDKQGNMNSQTDPDGNTTAFEYDLRRRMTKKIDPMGSVTTYEYDEADRQKSVTDANGNQTTFTYDTNGNLLTEKRADGATWSYTYDENFNRKTVTDPNGTVVTFIYDDADRVVEKQIAKGNNVLGPSQITMTPDDLGRTIATSTDEGVAETFAYDSLDRQLSESQQIGQAPKRSVERSFDPSGNVIGLKYPSGLNLTYDIDKLDRIAAIRDAANPAIPIVTYTDIGGRPVTKTFANGVTETWSYDPNRRLAEILSKVSSTTLRDVQYERSRAGDKLSAVRPDLGVKSTFTYNANHWMTNESTGIPLTGSNPQPALAVNYAIDPVLNMHSITRTTNVVSGTTSSATNFSINNRNQYTSAGSEPLSYDRNGNLTGRDLLAMQYDYENRLRKAALSTGEVVENVFDAAGRKVEEKITSGGTTHITEYALCGDQAKEEYVDGSRTNRFVYGRKIDEKVRAEMDGTIVFPVADELGSVDRITDNAGTTVEQYRFQGYGKFSIFDAVGAPRASSTYRWKWLFQGREHQPILEAYDFRARTLWPDLGRFGQEDPAKAHSETSPYQSLLGSPSNLTDPRGFYEEDVHHYLTIFLARAGGFAPATADVIGRETGHLDFDERDAMTLSTSFGDANPYPNTDNYARYHFPTPWQLDDMRNDVIGGTGMRDARAIGEYFHALEDSYSHQADPKRRDFSKRFHDNGIFGHAGEGHYPDWTWTRPALAVLMAQDVFEEMNRLYNAGNSLPWNEKEVKAGWSKIQPTVMKFIVFVPRFFDEVYFNGASVVPSVISYANKINTLDVIEPRIQGEYQLTAYEREARVDSRRISIAWHARHPR